MTSRCPSLVGALFLAPISVSAQLVSPSDSERAAALVRKLGEFPAALPAMGRSDGRPDVTEVRRRAVYEQLRTLGATAVPALIAGLRNRDVQVRRNVALFLTGIWADARRPHPDIRPILSALIAALEDSDARVRGLAAQAIGAGGAAAAAAVAALIRLLAYPDEGSRNSACIGLRGIGPAAKEGLPALLKALSDPSADVDTLRDWQLLRSRRRRLNGRGHQ